MRRAPSSLALAVCAGVTCSSLASPGTPRQRAFSQPLTDLRTETHLERLPTDFRAALRRCAPNGWFAYASAQDLATTSGDLELCIGYLDRLANRRSKSGTVDIGKAAETLFDLLARLQPSRGLKPPYNADPISFRATEQVTQMQRLEELAGVILLTESDPILKHTLSSERRVLKKLETSGAAQLRAGNHGAVNTTYQQFLSKSRAFASQLPG